MGRERDDDVLERSQALVARYQRGELSREAYLDQLRRDYHSLHARVRSEAVRLLDGFPEPERTRELIQLATDCQWRETQIAIIRVMAKGPTQRGLEFLIHIAADDDDLMLSREALAALGRSHDPLAARYLATRYRVGPLALKPYVVQALGELVDGVLVNQFEQDLTTAREGEHVLWTQSLTLALADLNAEDSVSELVELLQAEQRAVAVSALLALGKVAREPAILEPFEADFRTDFVEWQLYTQAKQLIEQRVSWSIEDVLEWVFDLKQPFQPGRVGELQHFLAAEVREGLEFFCDATHQLRLAEVLAYLRHRGVVDWMSELLDLTAMTDQELTDVFIALQPRADQALEPLLRACQHRSLSSLDDDLYEAWCRTCVLCLPQGGAVLLELMGSEVYTQLSLPRKVMTINQVVDYGLSVLGDEAATNIVVAGLEAVLDQEHAWLIQGRILRGLAQLRLSGPVAAEFAKAHLGDSLLLPSILQYLQICPQPQGLAWLTERVYERAGDMAAPLLAAMAAQPLDGSAQPREVDGLLRQALAGDLGQDTCLAALAFLSRHPVSSFFDGVLELAHGDERVRVAAIIALKGFANSRSTATLATCLHDTSASIVGRALDTLTAQPDDDARWVILNFLDERIHDFDIVDKIIRCLTPTERRRQQVAETLQKLIDAHPDHDHLDGLIQLRDRMDVSTRRSQRRRGLPAALVHAVDHELTASLEGFEGLGEPVKAALRSAELPYLHPDVFDGDIDKSTSIIEYCKAVDLFLERRLGTDCLFPKVRDDLAGFQNMVYRAGFNDAYPNPARVIDALGLQGWVSSEVLPLSKMVRVSQSVLNGRIQQAQWRVLDGLRAWSAVLLLFVRSVDTGASQALPVPIRIPRGTDEMIVDVALHLNRLQGLRNPVAHRRTLVEFADIETIRNDILELFAQLDALFC